MCYNEFSRSFLSRTHIEGTKTLESRGPEELSLTLYARIIIRTSYLVKYITSSFLSINLLSATFVNPICSAFFSFHMLYFSISIFALA